jgi:hypothetical protein
MSNAILNRLSLRETRVQEVDAGHSAVTLIFFEGENIAESSQKIEIKVIVEHEHNPILAELQGGALEQLRRIIDGEIRKKKDAANPLRQKHD